LVQEYRVVARNTARSSANKIHDDVVARRYGFRAGLVPGVDVYAYMTHPAAEVWGADWLCRGSLRARFLAPIYDGDEVSVVPGRVTRDEAAQVLPLEVRDGIGAVCATGEARLSDGSRSGPRAPLPTTWPLVAPAVEPRAASPEALAPGTTLALTPHHFHADRAPEYLSEIGETLSLYLEAGVAHPGWLLRDANYVLSTNVVLGPWIHVESTAQHHGLVHDGDTVEARATVTREWERNGHRFVELDVGLFADGDVVARVTHVAIYRPRREAA
jgi:acyl dehydratase